MAAFRTAGKAKLSGSIPRDVIFIYVEMAFSGSLDWACDRRVSIHWEGERDSEVGFGDEGLEEERERVGGVTMGVVS